MFVPIFVFSLIFKLPRYYSYPGLKIIIIIIFVFNFLFLALGTYTPEGIKKIIIINN